MSDIILYIIVCTCDGHDHITELLPMTPTEMYSKFVPATKSDFVQLYTLLNWVGKWNCNGHLYMELCYYHNIIKVFIRSVSHYNSIMTDVFGYVIYSLAAGLT